MGNQKKRRRSRSGLMGMSQDALAEQLGVTRKTVFNWMTSGNIPLGKLIDMADLFGCSIDYLLGRG